MGVKTFYAFLKEKWYALPFLPPCVSTVAKDGSGQLHRRKEPDGGTVEYLVWWLATRQNEAVHFWWFQF